MQAFERAVDRELVDLLAPLCRTLQPAVRASHRVDLGTMIVEAVLHLDGDGAAERVEAEGGIVRHHGDRFDRGGRDQIPVHSVAECLVDAHAVLIDRQSLRRARHGRCHKTAKLDIGLEWIAGHLADVDGGDTLLQGIRYVQRIGTLDLTGIDEVNGGRYLVDGKSGARARDRRCRIDRKSRDPGDDARRRPRSRRPCRGWGRRHFDRRKLGGIAPLVFVLRASLPAFDDKGRRHRRNKQDSNAHLTRPIPSGFCPRRFRKPQS